MTANNEAKMMTDDVHKVAYVSRDDLNGQMGSEFALSATLIFVSYTLIGLFDFAVIDWNNEHKRHMFVHGSTTWLV
jgi:hypothetical protein